MTSLPQRQRSVSRSGAAGASGLGVTTASPSSSGNASGSVREFKYTLSNIGQPHLCDVARVILHTVLLHRVFGNITPEERSVFTSTTWIAVDEPTVSAAVEDNGIKPLQKAMPNVTSQGQVTITVTFHNKVQRRRWFSGGGGGGSGGGGSSISEQQPYSPTSTTFGGVTGGSSHSRTASGSSPSGVVYEETGPWERWTFVIHVVSARTERERTTLATTTEPQLVDLLKMIMATIGENKDHIPPITSTEMVPFPFHITVLHAGEGWSSVLGRMWPGSS